MYVSEIRYVISAQGRSSLRSKIYLEVGGGISSTIFRSHIFCASNDDDAWKPHEFYELISPHAHVRELGSQWAF